VSFLVQPLLRCSCIQLVLLFLRRLACCLACLGRPALRIRFLSARWDLLYFAFDSWNVTLGALFFVSVHFVFLGSSLSVRAIECFSGLVNSLATECRTWQ
jgi:hypothetical protein